VSGTYILLCMAGYLFMVEIENKGRNRE